MPTEMDTASFMGFTGPAAEGADSGATHAKVGGEHASFHKAFYYTPCQCHGQ